VQLARLVVVSLVPAPEQSAAWELVQGDASVTTLAVWDQGGSKRLLYAATRPLARRPRLGKDALVIVPALARKELESLLETAADLSAVATRRRRSISSPTPCVALIPDSTRDAEWLREARGFRIEPGGHPDVEYPIEEDLIKAALTDRLDGVALLAEAISHGHATGKLVELVRFFERAFRLHSQRLVEALSGFLRGARLGYTQREVGHWVEGLRNPAVHATMKRVVFEGDVLPVITRVQQAAYDVLFNKLHWGSKTATRRRLLSPPTGFGPKGVFVRKETTAALKFQLLDDFGVYPLDLSIGSVQIPEEWWSVVPRSRVQQMGGTLEIRE
jgi:hypothetical protein